MFRRRHIDMIKDDMYLWQVNWFSHNRKLIYTNIDFYEEEGPDSGKDIWEKRHFWNRLNTELARWVTKTGPAIRDGRGLDIFRHELGWYPRSDVKESRKT